MSNERGQQAFSTINEKFAAIYIYVPIVKDKTSFSGESKHLKEKQKVDITSTIRNTKKRQIY
jgi:hypothetical protein